MGILNALRVLNECSTDDTDSPGLRGAVGTAAMYARGAVGRFLRIEREECNVGRMAFSPAMEAQKAGDSRHMAGAWRV